MTAAILILLVAIALAVSALAIVRVHRLARRVDDHFDAISNHEVVANRDALASLAFDVDGAKAYVSYR